jgi:proteasome accessory factor A
LESTGDEDRRRLDEARDVLRRWSETLRLLEEDPYSLLGRVDWVSKKFLIDQAGEDLSWESRKKIDLRYHELSPQGYFAQFARAGVAAALLTEHDLDRAVRTAPSGTPATTRGHYIREFAQGAIPLRVGWNRIVLGSGRAARVVWLHRFRRSQG